MNFNSKAKALLNMLRLHNLTLDIHTDHVRVSPMVEAAKVLAKLGFKSIDGERAYSNLRPIVNYYLFKGDLRIVTTDSTDDSYLVISDVDDIQENFAELISDIFGCAYHYAISDPLLVLPNDTTEVSREVHEARRYKITQLLNTKGFFVKTSSGIKVIAIKGQIELHYSVSNKLQLSLMP